jgi:hypothetical protein
MYRSVRFHAAWDTGFESCLGALSSRALEPVLTRVGLLCVLLVHLDAYAIARCATTEASEPTCVCVARAGALWCVAVMSARQ